MPYSSARTAPPWIVTIHTGEGILSRADMARFLDDNSGASAHAAGDAGGVDAPLVPYDRAAWTAGYTANNAGLHIELCAFAMLTREQWLSETDVTIYVPFLKANRTIRSPRSMLRYAAGWTAELCDRYGIPKRKVGAADLRAGRGGICGHADTTAAWGETDHTDPGTGFPWDVFISMVEGQEDNDMTPDQMKFEVLASEWRFDGRNPVDMWRHTVARVDEIAAAVATLAAKVDSLALGGGTVDVAALADAVNDEDDRRDRDGDPTTGLVS